MPKRKPRIQHAEIVQRFAARLREVRISRGMTQAELARQARMTMSYIGRLEGARPRQGSTLPTAWPGGLGTTVGDLLPSTSPPDTLGKLREQARKRLEDLLEAADRETLLMLCPLLARLAEATAPRQ